MFRKRLLISIAVLVFSQQSLFAADGIYREIRKTYNRIDTSMGDNTRELLVTRTRDSQFDLELNSGQLSSFGDQLTVEVIRHLQKSQIYLSNIGSIFSIPSSRALEQISLNSHPICKSTKTTLKKIIRRSASLSNQEVELVKKFEKRLNKSRREYLRDHKNIKPVIRNWSALAGCLAYTESLGDPDTSVSRRRAKELLGQGYTKPTGVKFYYDKGHENPNSRWNVGLYQFVLLRAGNINPCIKSWKAQSLPGNSIIKNLDLKDMGRFIGSPSQSFNAFCGLNKILQTFFVQVYTTRAKYTHPNNRMSDGTLKKPSDRCVSLHHGKAYSHFGPLTRTVVNSNRSGSRRSNLGKLMHCVKESNAD
ncbi:MAG: hypothetical protein GY927_23790 [bacterium]|nr:hypothetical protein [bacterium]